VDLVMRDLQVTLLVPVREVLRAAPVSARGVASDGSYTKWLTQVSEAMVTGRPLPKDFEQSSRRAYRDLAGITGRSRKDVAAIDLSQLAHRLVVYFDKQPADVRKTAAAYLESVFSIPG
jgi:hypothetical protein